MATNTAQAIKRKLQRRNIKTQFGLNKRPGIRRSVNSIPKVNANPRPPNEPKKNNPNKGTNNQALNNVQNPYSDLVPQPGQDDPRDAEYWRDLAVLMNNRNEGVRQLDIEGTYEKNNYDQELEELARQQPRDIQALRENANDAGAFYSSRTGENLGRLEQDYFNTRSGLERNYNQSSSLRALQRDSLESGYNLDIESLFADAIARRAGMVEDEVPPYVDPISLVLKNRVKNSDSNKRPPRPGPNFYWNENKKKWIKR